MENTELKEEKKNEVIFQIKKTESETLVVSKRTYKGISYIDLRVFFRPEGVEDLRPTRKGLTLTESLFSEVICGLSEIFRK